MIKILNVIGKLDTGGAEGNAVNVFNNLNLSKYQYEFLVFFDSIGVYENEITQQGGIIQRISEPRLNYLKFIREFNALLKKNKYDVIHVNTLWNSGLILLLARLNNIKIRICHSHSTRSSANENIKYKIYKNVMKLLIRINGNEFIGCGEEAGRYLFGKIFYKLRGKTIYNGIEFKKFQYNIQLRNKVRNMLNISDNTFVIGHVGRLAPVKNHSFMLEIMKGLISSGKNVKLLIVGDGPDRLMIENKLNSYNLMEYVDLLGNRKDVNEIINAFDLFIFPSLYEGFPVSLIEVQANSLPSIVSKNVTSEALIIEHQYHCDLENIEEWYGKINFLLENPVDRQLVDVADIKQQFDIKTIALQWEEIYDKAHC